jgi:glucuronoarabinoxylan endo-1,4-beta-xylanase
VAIIVNTATQYQTLDGFGVNVGYGQNTANGGAYDMPTISEAEADHFFGTGAGQLGFSIARYGCGSPTGTPQSIEGAQRAVARGAVLHVLPLQVGGKLGDPTWYTDGISLDADHYQDAANVIRTFVQGLVTAGATPDYVEPFNEPWSAWGGAWTDSNLLTFFNLTGATLAAAGITIPMKGPSGVAWDDVYADALILNATARGYLGVVSYHDYAARLTHPYAPAATYSKRVWMSEWCGNTTAWNPLMTGTAGGLAVARLVHDDLTQANINAWCWHLYKNDPVEGMNIGLWSESNAHSKREYTLANFAKFVRPGATRVSCTGAPAGVSATAYTNGYRRTVVLVNENATSTAVDISGLGTLASLDRWVTDATNDLAQQSSVAVSGGTASLTLAAQSVTTLDSVLLSVTKGPVSEGVVTLSGTRTAGTTVTVTRRV